MKYDFELDTNEDNALGKIIKQIKRGSVVLEFGPATGRMTKYLREKFDCKVYIVEIDAESAAIASKYAEDCIVGDIEQFEWLDKWADIKFDYMTFADVLEHLRDPQTVLDKTRMLLKDDGNVIISVPNVAHNALLINLHNNIFNYTPVGLLDDTHTHLFAYNTLKEFCFYAGYTAVIEDAVYSDVGENEVQASYQQVNPVVARALKERTYGNVYQYVFTLVKTSFFKINSIEIQKKIIPYMGYYHFQLFFDEGNGWCEENSITVKFNPIYESAFEFDLESYNNIRSIRIDPIECNAIIKVNEIKLIYEDYEERLSESELNTNAALKQDNIYIFEINDPNIYIYGDKLENIRRIHISMEYIDYDWMRDRGSGKFIQFIKEKEQNCQHLVSKENALNVELERCMAELDQRMQKNNELQNRYDEQKNELKLANEELERRAVELDQRMQKINELEQKNAEQMNELKLANEELERRAVELENRMVKINEMGRDICMKEEKIEHYRTETMLQFFKRKSE